MFWKEGTQKAITEMSLEPSAPHNSPGPISSDYSQLRLLANKTRQSLDSEERAQEQMVKWLSNLWTDHGKLGNMCLIYKSPVKRSPAVKMNVAY